MTLCPECGDEYERIASHWSNSTCGYPEITEDQRAALDGLMLGGSNVDGQGSNRHLLASTVSSPLAEWTAEQLDWLHHGTRVVHGDADNQDVYRVRTAAHPAINRYERWGDGETRAPPDDYDLTPLAGRVWYAFAGGLQWHGDYDSQRTATFSALKDSRAAWIIDVLGAVGFAPTRAGKRVQLRPTETTRLLGWIGDPVPGAVYKWADSLIEYQTLRENPLSEADYWTTVCQCALKVAAERTDQPLNADLFDRRVDVVDAETVAEILGGGNFESALSVAGVPARKSKEDTGIEKHSKTEMLSAIREVDERVEGPLTRSEYDEYRDSDHPSYSTIVRRYGWNSLKREIDLDLARRRGETVTEEDAITSVREVNRHVDGRLTQAVYDEHRDIDHPPSGTIASLYGWNDLKERAGLEGDWRED
jgi:hypothetical protein